MNIVSIIGTRPQFVKHATFQRYLDLNDSNIKNHCIHTGQHYDKSMTVNICRDFGIDLPKYELKRPDDLIGHSIPGMTKSIYDKIIELRPKYVVLYGDTNSTLAGCMAANSLGIPIIHVEAGLRSFDMRMPEERNRVITDRLSQFLIVPSNVAIINLKEEGFPHHINANGKNILQNIYNFGDIMYDSYILMKDKLKKSDTQDNDYVLLTLHREQLFTDKLYLENICRSIKILAERENVIFPAHPRIFKDVMLSKRFTDMGVKLMPSFDYLEMQSYLSNAKFIVTDSGGLQKEAYFHKKFCITLRENTEWIETLDYGCNQLVGASAEKFLKALHNCQSRLKNGDKFQFSYHYGDGKFCEKLAILLKKGK